MSKNLRMRFIDIKTAGGSIKGKTAFYCAVLHVTRQGFYWYLTHRNTPWKYEGIAEKMRDIVAEDECNDTYGRCRMYQALKLKYPEENIPSERTVYRIMEEIGLGHRPNRKPNGITKADRDARKSDDLFKRDFTAGKPLEKCVTDITEIPARDGKLYVSAIFRLSPLGRRRDEAGYESLEALILYLMHKAPEDEQNFALIMDMLACAGASEEDESYKSPLDILFERLADREPGHIAVEQYNIFKLAAGVICSKQLLNHMVFLMVSEVLSLSEKHGATKRQGARQCDNAFLKAKKRSFVAIIPKFIRSR